MLVPIRSMSATALIETKPMDLSRDFTHECGQHSFFVKPSASKFCLKSVFTLTTSFNNGALPCNCDSLGSWRRTCQSYGGQCQCQPNVIGRTCNRCRTGFSGFPYCGVNKKLQTFFSRFVTTISKELQSGWFFQEFQEFQEKPSPQGIMGYEY